MTLTVSLAADTETLLRAEAATHGMDVTVFAGPLLDEAVRRGQDGGSPPPDDWERDLRRFIGSLPRRLSPLPAEATRRSSFYDDAT